MKILLFLLVLLMCSQADASDNELHLGKFSAGDLTGWKEQTIGLLKPKTTYNLIKENDRTVLVAHSIKSASGRIYTLNLDPKEYPTLKWSWKINHTIKKGDEKTKAGEDFAARVYVIFPRGFFSKTRSICYVWANKLPKGEHVASPFTPNIITVAVDSGEEQAGRWISHERNIHDDYRKFFGEEPLRIGGVALMTDTDNTGESAFGYYGDISMVRSEKVPDVKHKGQKARETPPKEPKVIDQNHKVMPPNGEPTVPNSNTPLVGPKPEATPQMEPNPKEQPVDTAIPPPPAVPTSPAVP
ncbi:MAG: DUF3047 domain-containing protein [Desulfuromonadales bacterium]|nr:DUF3047 domain-containing protein [Desulfuromonadales bacterium]